MPRFKDYPDFQPNLTPRQMCRQGIFLDWGGYWRPIDSAVVGRRLHDQDREFPFLRNVPRAYLVDPSKNVSRNRFGVSCGSGLEAWEAKGWIHPQDPYGWVQWYCRFYQGRRTADDARQIQRWLRLAGPRGRFRRMLQNKIAASGAAYDDVRVSPTIRQVLLQWGYDSTRPQ